MTLEDWSHVATIVISLSLLPNFVVWVRQKNIKVNNALGKETNALREKVKQLENEVRRLRNTGAE